MEQIIDKARLAILIPTYRWDVTSKAVLAAYTAAAVDEVVVLVADNSENSEKHKFLDGLASITPNYYVTKHKKNIGAQANFNFLYEWSSQVEYFAIVADDDWSTPDYHVAAFQSLLAHNRATSASCGSTLIQWGNNRITDGRVPSMVGVSPAERISKWSYMRPRITMYNVGERIASEPALKYLANTPVGGAVLHESVMEICRLIFGDFIDLQGRPCYLHYPFHAEDISRTVRMLCTEYGLRDEFIHLAGLSTAVQCAVFISGMTGGFIDDRSREYCVDIVFKKIFTESFAQMVNSPDVMSALVSALKKSEAGLIALRELCDEQFLRDPRWTQAVLNNFIALLEALEVADAGLECSKRFKKFVSEPFLWA